MNEITINNKTEFAHEYLEKFIALYHEAKRGGVHDVIEVSVYKMVSHAIENIECYLNSGHKEVNANEIMHIIYDSFQYKLDEMKRNLEKMKEVNFE